MPELMPSGAWESNISVITRKRENETSIRLLDHPDWALTSDAAATFIVQNKHAKHPAIYFCMDEEALEELGRFIVVVLDARRHDG